VFHLEVQTVLGRCASIHAQQAENSAHDRDGPGMVTPAGIPSRQFRHDITAIFHPSHNLL
ncbi:hypothetical protein MK398_11500, partial [Streptococcus sanguinis]|nr:hypothetical protein [Streptococcus sanguinis]